MASPVKAGQESPPKVHVVGQGAVDFGQPVTCGIYPKSASHAFEQGGFMRRWLKSWIGTKLDDNPFVTWLLRLIVKNKSVRNGRHQCVNPVRLFFCFPCLALLELRVRGEFLQSVVAFSALLFGRGSPVDRNHLSDFSARSFYPDACLCAVGAFLYLNIFVIILRILASELFFASNVLDEFAGGQGFRLIAPVRGAQENAWRAEQQAKHCQRASPPFSPIQHGLQGVIAGRCTFAT